MISSDKISLFTVITGPRGSLKTLLMTSFVCQRLIKAYYLNTYYHQNVKVWTNYPVAFWYQPLVADAQPVYLQSLPLNMEALYCLDDILDSSWIFIDEIDLWADCQEWATVTQKLLTAAFQQVRKKKLNIMATIQSFEWLNKRLKFQTDIQVRCREAAFSHWGRERDLDLGEVAFLTWMDKSGVMTGYTYDESGRTFSQMFFGKRFWNCYDTSYQFDVLASKTRYKLKAPVKEIIIGEQSKPDVAENIILSSERKQRDMVLLAHMVEEYINRGNIETNARVFLDDAKNRGITSGNVAGRILADLGVRVNGAGAMRSYDFSGV